MLVSAALFYSWKYSKTLHTVSPLKVEHSLDVCGHPQRVICGHIPFGPFWNVRTVTFTSSECTMSIPLPFNRNTTSYIDLFLINIAWLGEAYPTMQLWADESNIFFKSFVTSMDMLNGITSISKWVCIFSIYYLRFTFTKASILVWEHSMNGTARVCALVRRIVRRTGPNRLAEENSKDLWEIESKVTENALPSH